MINYIVHSPYKKEAGNDLHIRNIFYVQSILCKNF